MFKFLINKNYKKVEKYQILVKKIKNIQKDIEKFSNQELKNQTQKLKQQLIHEKNLNIFLPEAFATALEATKRVLKLNLFDVQIIGGIVLHEGKISEMQTGEGKTLVSILPAYLNALSQKGVHIITVNDYLAKRDYEWVGEVHKFLGLKVGLIQQNMTYSIRKLNYSADITYITNSELGFDYLKDNMAIEQNEIVQRCFSYAIVDEVDSILIDEARTPLIISGPAEGSVTKYKAANTVANQLQKNRDYEVDEKNRSITLTDNGIIACEHKLNTNNLYDLHNPWAQFILNALKSKELFLKDQHYIIRDNLIIIVDEFTGRVMSGRRWSDGLHQAIEAKEKVTIQKENQILASITYQNLFLLYEKLSGMTGTAKTEETEFDKIYNLEIIKIPTNKICIRKEMPDLVYKTEYAKWEAVARECYDMNKLGRPILVGTTNIEKSELLANILTEYQLNYNLLNAKPENIVREAEIIAQAGKKHALTISTNMAGRGTDIILGGNATAITKLLLSKTIKKAFYNINIKDTLYCTDNINKIIHEYSSHINRMQIFKKIPLDKLENYIHQIIYTNQELNTDQNIINTLFTKLFKEYHNNFKKEREEIIQLGGLHVIGTERHESRRIDNQLRGRSGRQGDPGSSRFFLSLEDNLLRIFGGEKIANLMENLNIDDNTPIESTILSKSLDNAQKKVEAYFYDTRKQLFDYDEVINNQRQAIYSERKKILESYFIRDCIIEYAENTIDELLLFYNIEKNKKNKQKIIKQIHNLLNLAQPFKIKEYDILGFEELKNFLYEQLRITYDLREAYLEQLKPGLIRQLEKYYLLQQIDKAWQEHLEKMTILRESIGWRSYGQQDPLIEYKNEAFLLFVNMTNYIRQTVVYLIMRSRLITNT